MVASGNVFKIENLYLLIIPNILIVFVSIAGTPIAEIDQPQIEDGKVEVPTARFAEWVMVGIY